MATYAERVDQGQSSGPSMTTVVNITKCKDFNAKRGRDDDDPTRNPGDVYIGRYHWDPKHGLYQKSDWHNSYRASLRTKGGRVAEKRDGTRAEVVEKYGQYILGKPGKTFLGTKPRTPPNILKRIPELKGKRLGCWCRPDDCHGDLLAKWADEGIPSD